MTLRTPFIRLFPVEKYHKNVPFPWLPTNPSQFRSGVTRDALTASENPGKPCTDCPWHNYPGRIDGSQGQPEVPGMETDPKSMDFVPEPRYTSDRSGRVP